MAHSLRCVATLKKNNARIVAGGANIVEIEGLTKVNGFLKKKSLYRKRLNCIDIIVGN